MTTRSSSLAGIADAFLVGERPIARRIDDSIVRGATARPAVCCGARADSRRRPSRRCRRVAPILALGGDLKNAITLVVDGQAFASQHVGDLEHLVGR